MLHNVYIAFYFNSKTISNLDLKVAYHQLQPCNKDCLLQYYYKDQAWL